MNKGKVSPTVLLVDNLKNDVCLTRSWLLTNGFNVREVANVWDALDDATDFTGAARPAMILLNNALSKQDCQFVLDSLQEFTTLQHIPIVALANHETDAGNADEFFVQIENLEMLKSLLDSRLTVYPVAPAIAATAAA